MCQIRTVFDFNRELQNGAFAWPGGYPRFAVMSDGDALCFKCVEREAGLIRDAVISESRDGWRVVAIDINWEDDSLTCAHCGEAIQCAYPPDYPGRSNGGE